MEANQQQKSAQMIIPMDQQTLNQKAETEYNHKNRVSSLNEEKYSSKIDESPYPCRLNFSKPKSRFVESCQRQPIRRDDAYAPIKFFQPISGPLSGEDDDEDQLELEDEEDSPKRRQKNKIKWGLLIEWGTFFIILSALICSLTAEGLKGKRKYDIHIWRWCLMMMGIISGRLISGWILTFLIFFVERNFMLREKVLYFIYGLRKSFRNQLWLALVLIAWNTMFSHKEVATHPKLLKRIFKLLISTLAGTTIWLLKILAVKFLASSFHVTTFFDRLKENVFHHYILETLSGPPLLDSEMKGARTRRIYHTYKLRKLSMANNTSALCVKRLVHYVMSSGMSKTVDDFGKAELEITSEKQARNWAARTFKNVAKPNAKYIELDDLLLKFLTKEEVETIFPYFEGATETGQIRKSAFRNWVVRAYRERKSLAHSLNDTKTAVKQLHKLGSAIVLVVILVIFLLVMGLISVQVLLLVSSQLLLIGFMCQNTCKCIFESIIFVFIMHPFDVGDRCVIDKVQMVVEEMNILTTVFLGDDNEKVFYPNSVLSTKAISNFYRSPEMGDSVDFTLSVSTPVEKVHALKMEIKAYIESKPMYWNPDHCVIVKEIENVDKMKMALCVLHTMNHQDYGEKTLRKSELVFELKRIFEKLGIKYNVLPQELYFTGGNMTKIARMDV